MTDEAPVAATPRDDALDGRDIDDLVLYEIVEPHIARVTLNRPERRNAILSPDMQDEIARKFALAEDDDDVKVVILAAAGTHFCAGEDLRRLPIEGMGMNAGEKRLPQSKRIRGSSHLHETLDRLLLYSDKTTIAACQGAVIGAGLHLAITADMVVASESAYFGRPQARIGFSAFNTLLPVFVMKLGVNRAFEVLVTGETLSSATLKEWGVVNRVVPDDQLASEALRLARAIAMHSTDGLMISRKAFQMFWSQIGMATWSSFIGVAHPLFTNMVWRDDEYNFLRERNKVGHLEAMAELKRRWSDVGFE